MKKNPLILIILLSIILFLQSPAFGATYRMSVLGGNNQKVQVGRPAPNPIVLQILDNRGVPRAAKVEFKVIKGQGKVSKKNVKTDSAGRVKVNFVAGYKAGKVVVEARTARLGLARRLHFTTTLDNPNKKKKTHKKPSTEPTTVKKPAVKKPTVKKPTVKKPAVKKPVPRPKPKKGTPSIIIGFAGSGQTVPPGEMASKKLEVQVLDENGNTLKGVEVEFKVITGDGKCLPSTATTNRKGIAKVSLRAGDSTGKMEIQAATLSKKDLSTLFTVHVKRGSAVKPRPTPQYTPNPKPTPRKTVVPRPRPTRTPGVDNSRITIPKRKPRPKGHYTRDPKRVSVVGGNYQSASAGVRLPAPLVVYVTDDDGNPVDATVQFTVLGGDAAITNRQVHTDERGLASTFVVVNSSAPVRIVAEVMEKPGLSTIAYANTRKPGGNNNSDTNPIIKSSTPTNQPGFPSAIAFYSLKSQNTSSIEKTGVVQLEIGVSDFRNQPVATPIRFSVVKGNIKILNPIVNTNQDGRGICYVELGTSMGIFTIRAQSLENPDLKAVFRSGPQIRTGPDTKVVRPGSTDTRKPGNNTQPDMVPPPPGAGNSGKPALIAVVNGGGQKGKPGRKLPQPLEVLVTDPRGNPVADTMVSFIVFRGKADLEKRFARTNKDGKVSNRVTLGNWPGTVEIAIRVRDNKKLRTTVQLEVVK